MQKKKRIRVITFLVMMLASFSMNAQNLLWSIQSNPSAFNDVPNCPVMDTSGVYFAGFDYQIANNNSQWRIEKRDLSTGAALNPSFGTTGIVQENQSVSDDVIFIDGIDIDKTGLYVVGTDRAPGNRQWHVEKRDLTTGTIVWMLPSNNFSAGNDDATGVAVNASGVFVVGSDLSLGNAQWRIEKYDPVTGAVVTAFGTSGVVINNLSAGADSPNSIAADSAYIYIAGYDNVPGNRQWRIEKRDAVTGVLDAAFGTGGVVNLNPTAGTEHANAITVDGTGVYVVGSDNSPGNLQWRMIKLDITTGAILWDQTNNPSATLGDEPYDVEVDATGVYITGREFSVGAGNAQIRIEKRSKVNGVQFGCSPALSNPSSGSDWLYGIAPDGQGNVYGCGNFNVSGGDNAWIMQKWDMCCNGTPAIAGDDTICRTDSTTLTASGGTSYVWNTGDSTAVIKVSPLNTTTYTITITSSGGCTQTATQTVTVNFPPIVITGNSTICAGDTAVLNAGGGVAYTWNTGASTPADTVSPGGTTTYTVTVTDINSCTLSVTQQVTVNLLPVVNITGNTTICVGDTTILTASGGSSYTWNTGTTTDADTLSPGGSTTYTVTVTDVNACTATAIQPVTVNLLPAVSISGTSVICQGTQTVLTATGGNTYIWSNGITTAKDTVSPASTQTYTVTATDLNLCFATDTMTVNVNLLPVAAISGPDSVCEGSSTVLTGSGGLLYFWGSGTFGPTDIITPAGTSIYSLLVMDANFCAAVALHSVSTKVVPIVNITGVTTICEGDTTILTASGGGTYSWNNGSLTAADTISPAGTATYTVTVTGSNTCTASATQPVTVDLLPVINITGDTAICPGDSTILTATGGGIYNWNTGSTTAADTVSPSGNATYTVTVTGINTCTASATRSVTINLLPTVNITGDTIICIGDTTVLTASGGGTYSWNTGITTAADTISPVVPTTYTVTVTGINTCTATGIQSVTINALPTTSITGVATICEGDSTILTASGGGTYSWNTGSTTVADTVSPGGNVTYTVTVTDGNSCTATSTQSVTVDLLPVINITGVTTICFGDTTILTASGGGNYSWNTGSGTATDTVSPGGNATYTVTVTGANTCTASAIQSVAVNLLPIINITGDASICKQDSTILTATGGVTYSWNTGATSASDTLAPLATTTYTVTVTSINNCTATASKTVNMNPLPMAAYTYVSSCLTDSVVFTDNSSISTGSITQWDWDFGDASTSVLQDPFHVYALVDTFQVMLTVTSDSGCVASNTNNAIVKPRPVIAFSNSLSCVTGLVSFVNTSTVIGNDSIISWLWDFGNTNASILKNPTQLYPFQGNYLVSLQVTTQNGCVKSATQPVFVVPAPVADYNPSGGQFKTGQTINFFDQSSNPGSFKWNFGNVNDTSILQNPDHAFDFSGNYNVSLIVSNASGCYDTVMYVFNIMGSHVNIPTAFSPNGDDLNDLFRVIGGPFNRYDLRVFNEWGQQIFQSADQNDGWDGTFNGKDQAGGGYVYIFNGITYGGEEVTLKGEFALTR